MMSVEAESNRTGDEGKLPNHYTYINITTTSPTTLLHRGDRLFSRTDGRLESIKTSDEKVKCLLKYIANPVTTIDYLDLSKTP